MTQPVLDPGGGGGTLPSLTQLTLMYIDAGVTPFDAAQYALKAWATITSETWSQSGLG